VSVICFCYLRQWDLLIIIDLFWINNFSSYFNLLFKFVSSFFGLLLNSILLKTLYITSILHMIKLWTHSDLLVTSPTPTLLFVWNFSSCKFIKQNNIYNVLSLVFIFVLSHILDLSFLFFKWFILFSTSYDITVEQKNDWILNFKFQVIFSVCCDCFDSFHQMSKIQVLKWFCSLHIILVCMLYNFSFIY
jgi:hypothetical protein